MGGADRAAVGLAEVTDHAAYVQLREDDRPTGEVSKVHQFGKGVDYRKPRRSQASAATSGHEICIPDEDDFSSRILQPVELDPEYSCQICNSGRREEIRRVGQ
jgi:hypothetical protein